MANCPISGSPYGANATVLVRAERRAMSKFVRTIALAVGLVASAGHPALSQSAGAIKVVVPFPAGGTADTLARLLVDQIVRTQDVTLIVDNRLGANGVIGTAAAAHAAPNGSTVLLVPNAFLV